MKNIIFGVFVLAVVLFVSACDSVQDDPRLAKSMMALPGGGLSGGVSIPSEPAYLDNLPEPFVVDGSYDNVAMIVSYLRTDELSARTTLKTYFDGLIVDGSFPTLIDSNQNISSYNHLVLLGSPCYNRHVAYFMDLTYPACGSESTIPEGMGIIKLVEKDGQTALIIAAYDGDVSEYAATIYKGADMVASGGLTGTGIIFGGVSSTITYQKILNMLNSAELIKYDLSNMTTGTSCDDICLDVLKTCVHAERQGFGSPSIQEPTECDANTPTEDYYLYCWCAVQPA